MKISRELQNLRKLRDAVDICGVHGKSMKQSCLEEVEGCRPNCCPINLAFARVEVSR